MVCCCSDYCYCLAMSLPPPSSSSSSMTLGGPALRSLVLDAATKDCDESESQSLHGIYWMEHLNLVVGSDSLAEYFYLELLGLTRDEGKSLHVNLGQQQFHLKETNTNTQNDDDNPIQTIAGSIGLAVPSLESVRGRLKEADNVPHVFEILEDHLGDDDDDDDHGMMTVMGPWRNVFHLYDITSDFHNNNNNNNNNNKNTTAELRLKQPLTTPQKMTNLHSPGGAYGVHRMAVRGRPGIRFLEVACPAGKSGAVARFYREVLGCTVHHRQMKEEESSSSSSSSIGGWKGRRACAVVNVGPGVHLCFVEQQQQAAADEEEEALLLANAYRAMRGVHVCFYVNDFEALYHRLDALQLIWTNPRFVHLDTCDTWEEAKASFTLRFKTIVDLETLEPILELEHETRPLRHGQYLKVPKYEPN
jgi:catechol 2,3-dioxygenase-like lactoylglutathione lyase family enzyme